MSFYGPFSASFLPDFILSFGYFLQQHSQTDWLLFFSTSCLTVRYKFYKGQISTAGWIIILDFFLKKQILLNPTTFNYDLMAIFVFRDSPVCDCISLRTIYKYGCLALELCKVELNAARSVEPNLGPRSRSKMQITDGDLGFIAPLMVGELEGTGA